MENGFSNLNEDRISNELVFKKNSPMGGTSEAERVLRQKFELLKRKRQQELQEQEQERRRGGGHGLGGRSSKPFAPPPLAHDPVRLAAVAALKAKREEKQGDKALSSEPPEKKRLTVSGKPTSIKLGFKVSSGVAKPANVAPQSGQPPESLAPLENKPVPRLKRPVLRRPAVVRKVDSSQGDQPEDQSQPEDNFEKQPLEETKEAYNNQAEGE